MTRMSKFAALAALGSMILAAPAMAGGFSFNFGYSKHRPGRAWGFGFEFGRPGYVVPAPVYVPPPVVVAPAPLIVEPAPVVVAPPPRVWVPPVYQTVAERVWVPTVQTRYRDVPVFDVYGNVVSYRREPYTVQSGHWREVQRRVCVREGYWAIGEAPVAGAEPQGEAGEPGYTSPAPQAQPEAPPAPEGGYDDDGTVRYERQQRQQRSLRASHAQYHTIVE